MLNRTSRYVKRTFRRIVSKLRQASDIKIENWLAYYKEKASRNRSFSREQNPVPYPCVSIIILTFNNLTFTQLCLESIYANTSYPNFEVIVVDNASIDATQDWLRKYAEKHNNLQLILNTENKGFASGNNQAVKIAKGEFLIFLNNDTVVTSFWIERFLFHFKSDSQIGLVGPVTNSTGNEARILANYKTPSQMEKFAEARSQEMAGVSFDIRMLAFYCVMTRKDQYEIIGGLDEQFGVGMFEDDDLAVRYHQQGYRVVCAEDVFIHHFQGASFGKLENNKYSEIFEENRKKYEKKWGRKWKPYQLRSEVMRHLQGD